MRHISVELAMKESAKPFIQQILLFMQPICERLIQSILDVASILINLHKYLNVLSSCLPESFPELQATYFTLATEISPKNY